jgi:DHA1 family multidrug resistance protein-like MFS transporter
MGAVEPLLHSMIGMQTPPAQRGIVFGSQTFVGSMGWFISPLIGSSISVFLGIRYIFLFHSIGIALSFIIILVLNRRAALIEPAHPSYSIKK